MLGLSQFLLILRRFGVAQKKTANGTSTNFHSLKTRGRSTKKSQSQEKSTSPKKCLNSKHFISKDNIDSNVNLSLQEITWYVLILIPILIPDIST